MFDIKVNALNVINNTYWQKEGQRKRRKGEREKGREGRICSYIQKVFLPSGSKCWITRKILENTLMLKTIHRMSRITYFSKALIENKIRQIELPLTENMFLLDRREEDRERVILIFWLDWWNFKTKENTIFQLGSWKNCDLFSFNVSFYLWSCQSFLKCS